MPEEISRSRSQDNSPLEAEFLVEAEEAFEASQEKLRTVFPEPGSTIEGPLASTEDDPWDWDASVKSVKRKKREKAQAQIQGSSVPEPSLAMKDNLIEPELPTETMQNPPVNEGFDVSSGAKLVVLDEIDCPFRRDHLSLSGAWSGCKQCELYVRRIALNLCSAEPTSLDSLQGKLDSRCVDFRY